MTSQRRQARTPHAVPEQTQGNKEESLVMRLFGEDAPSRFPAAPHTSGAMHGASAPAAPLLTATQTP